MMLNQDTMARFVLQNMEPDFILDNGIIIEAKFPYSIECKNRDKNKS